MLTDTKPKLKISQRLLNLFSKPKFSTENLEPWPYPIDGVKPEPVFRLGAKTYYHFANDLNARTKRVMAGYDIQNKVRYNLTAQHLNEYFEEIEKACKKNDLHRIAILTHEVKKRQTYIRNFDLLFELASVFFFDKNEDPHDYDFDYAAKKIATWKASKDVPAFFFIQPIAAFHPFSDMSNLDIQNYLTIREVQRESLEQLSQLLSNTPS